MSFLSDMLESLNHAQRKAVEAPEGHLLIHAAAGTGKTRTLAARILYLQREMDVPSGAILGLSFSRSARQQLIERLLDLCWDARGGSPIQVLTFHGLAWRVVRLAIAHGETWLKPGFEVAFAGRGNINPVFEKYFKELFKGIVKTSNLLSLKRGGQYPKHRGTDMFEHMENIEFNMEEDWHTIPEMAVLVWAKGLDMLRQGHPEFGRALLSPEDVPVDKLLTVFGKHYARLQVNSSELKEIWNRYNRILKRENIIDYPGIVIEALRILKDKKSKAASRVRDGLRFIMVDEYQDTSRAQEALLFELACKGANINVVGDSRQAIYTFNGSDVSNILEFPKRAALTGKRVLETVYLTWNYRSSRNILLLANRVIAKIEHPMYSTNAFDQGVLEPAQVPLHGAPEMWRHLNPKVRRVFAPRLDLAADFIATEIKRLVEEENILPGQIAVLVRKDSSYSPQATKTREYLENQGIPLVKSEPDPDKTAHLVQAAITICQYHFDDGIESLIHKLENEKNDFGIEMDGVSCTDVVHLLREAWQAGAVKAWDAMDILQDMLEENVDKSQTDNGVSIRTVHSAKGAEFRIIFILYLGDSSFPHGRRHDPAEERRLFYVGITRAMERLYLIGVPGLHHANFFGESEGEGVCYLDWMVPGGQEVFSGPGLSMDVVKNIEDTKGRQREEEERQKRLLAEWLNTLD